MIGCIDWITMRMVILFFFIYVRVKVNRLRSWHAHPVRTMYYDKKKRTFVGFVKKKHAYAFKLIK